MTRFLSHWRYSFRWTFLKAVQTCYRNEIQGFSCFRYMQDCSFGNILKKIILLCEDCDQCSQTVFLLFFFYMHRLIPAFLPESRIGQALSIITVNYCITILIFKPLCQHQQNTLPNTFVRERNFITKFQRRNQRLQDYRPIFTYCLFAFVCVNALQACGLNVQGMYMHAVWLFV